MRIKFLRLSQTIEIPGTKIAGVNSINGDKFPGVEMETCEQGVLVTLKGHRALIWGGNILSAVLYEDEKEPSSGRSKLFGK